MRLHLKPFLFFIIFIFFANGAYAQNLEVVVVNSLNKPLEGISVFVKEAALGLVSNKDGITQASLPDGTYTLSYKHPGYKWGERIITIPYNDSLPVKIILQKDSLYIPALQPRDNENLAIEVIKEAIYNASIYASSAGYYKANSYIKGDFSIKKVSDIIDKITFFVQKHYLSDIKNKKLTQEIYNEIEYSYPDNYNVRILASAGNIPNEFNEKGIIEYIDGSIYSSRFNDYISPLNVNASMYYRYKYEGYYINRGNVLHKIKVESKLKDPELLNGYLYIADGDWYVDHAELTAEVGGITQLASISYHNIRGKIFLPVTYFINIAFQQLGTGGEVKYYTSLKYETINENVDKNVIGDITSDPLAEKRDEHYWEKKRTLPLSDEEGILDSIHFSRERFNPSNFLLGKIILGGYIFGNDSSKISARYNGVKMVFRDYNYVDGFWLGERFDVKARLQDNKSLEFHPYIYYATARKRLLWGSDVIYNYKPRKRGKLTFDFGSKSADFNSQILSRYQNYFASLILGENYNFFYQKDYFSVNNSINPISKLKISATLGIEKRSGLSNNTDFNILGRNKIKPNIYPDDRFDRTYYTVNLLYTPFSGYAASDVIEMMERRVPIIFSAEYQESFSGWQKNNSTYSKIKGSFIHNIELDYFTHIDYKIESGVFIRRGSKMHFADYQHFGATDIIIDLGSLFDSFLLLDNYELQTNKYWVNVSLNYSGKYILLKYIPFLQGKPFTENLHLKSLLTPNTDLYTELGYSISITRRIGIGGYASFNNTKAKKFGVRFSLDLSSLGIK